MHGKGLRSQCHLQQDYYNRELAGKLKEIKRAPKERGLWPERGLVLECPTTQSTRLQPRGRLLCTFGIRKDACRKRLKHWYGLWIKNKDVIYIYPFPQLRAALLKPSCHLSPVACHYSPYPATALERFLRRGSRCRCLSESLRDPAIGPKGFSVGPPLWTRTAVMSRILKPFISS